MDQDRAVENLGDRLTQEVTLLSTKLVTAVAKQLELEERNLQLHRDNQSLKSQVQEMAEIRTRYDELMPQHQRVVRELGETKVAKEKAESQNTKLQGEVEDLTASLFNEANEMVSNASRETYNFKVKNRKLYEELDEKNTIIENLQEQLQDLKVLFIKIEDKQRVDAGTNREKRKSDTGGNTGGDEEMESMSDQEELGDKFSQLNSIVFSPNVRATRYDVSQYQLDFKSFIYNLIKPEFVFELSTLKTFKFFRKIWSEEIEPSLPSIPSIQNASFINRWQKGRNFWSMLVEGRAVIAPVSGVNETYKLTYKGDRLNKDVPVAIKDTCSFCGESRDDRLEYSRLYMLKLLGPESGGGAATGDNTSSNSPGNNHQNSEPLVSYPLCNYCLIKLRNICDFFAKLRLIHTNVYKLRLSSEYDDSNTHNFQFRRSFTNANDTDTNKNDSPAPHKVLTSAQDQQQEYKIMKLYLMINLIRSKIFWSKIGYWDNADDIHGINIDEIHFEAFKDLYNPSIANNTTKSPNGNAIGANSSEVVDDDDDDDENAGSEVFADTSEAFHSDPNLASATASNQHPHVNSQTTTETTTNSTQSSLASPALQLPDPADQGLARSKSNSKQFKQRMNQDLDDTLKMLRESIIDDGDN